MDYAMQTECCFFLVFCTIVYFVRIFFFIRNLNLIIYYVWHLDIPSFQIYWYELWNSRDYFFSCCTILSTHYIHFYIHTFPCLSLWYLFCELSLLLTKTIYAVIYPVSTPLLIFWTSMSLFLKCLTLCFSFYLFFFTSPD